MPERFDVYVVYKRRYINTLPFISFYNLYIYRYWGRASPSTELDELTESRPKAGFNFDDGPIAVQH